MLENTRLYDLPKPKTLNLEYLWLYLFILNLNTFMRKYNNYHIANNFTSKNMGISKRHLARQKVNKNINFCYQKRLFYINRNHQILKLNQQNEQ